MDWILLLDKVRYIPILHCATLWGFGVINFAYPGFIKRFLKMFLFIIVSTIISGMVGSVLSWGPDLLLGIGSMLCVYGIILSGILSIRDEILYLRKK